MLKKIIALVLILQIFIIPVKALDMEIYSITNYQLNYIDTDNIIIIQEQMEICQQYMTSAHNLAESIRAFGISDSNPVIISAKNMWQIANENYIKYEEKYNFWIKKYEEYPIATKIWVYLRELGYNKEVCAGILGNIMAEVGGNTLKIKYSIYNSKGNYYGICQWSTVYYYNVKDLDLKGQCDFLRDTIKYEFDTFGHRYQEDFKFIDFLDLTDYKETALAFAKSYERCAEYTYDIRQQNAETAYKYFSGEE